MANYPFDDSATGQDIEAPTADDKQFVFLAYSYARAHPNMSITGCRCGLDVDGLAFFFDGITNGADWYHLAGMRCTFKYSDIHARTVRCSAPCCYCTAEKAGQIKTRIGLTT